MYVVVRRKLLASAPFCKGSEPQRLDAQPRLSGRHEMDSRMTNDGRSFNTSWDNNQWLVAREAKAERGGKARSGPQLLKANISLGSERAFACETAAGQLEREVVLFW